MFICHCMLLCKTRVFLHMCHSHSHDVILVPNPINGREVIPILIGFPWEFPSHPLSLEFPFSCAPIVVAKWWRCYAAIKETAGLEESNDSLPPGLLWLMDHLLADCLERRDQFPPDIEHETTFNFRLITNFKVLIQYQQVLLITLRQGRERSVIEHWSTLPWHVLDFRYVTPFRN